MSALDTNVLLRYIVEDDPKQCALAKRYVQQHCTEDHPAFINRIVLCEFTWVLKKVYKFSKMEISDTLERLLQTSQFTIENHDDVSYALGAYKKHAIGFADTLIGVLNKKAGYMKTATFDANAGALADFELLA